MLQVEPFDRDQTTGRPLIPADGVGLYRFGALIRGCEQLLLDLFRRDQVSGTVHTCLGQELCQMSVVRALCDPEDAVFSNHRGHGHFLSYTGDFAGLVAEIMGRSTGVCQGRGGSQHLGGKHFQSGGVLGGLTAIAVGKAMDRKWRGKSSLTVAFIGDGTLGEGLLYESLNLASIWAAPVLFVVEDNGMSQSTKTAAMIGGGSLAARLAAFGLPIWEFDDAAETCLADVERAVAAVRASGGAGGFIIKTARLGPHSKGDDTRDAAELAALKARDPLARLRDRLPESDCTRVDAEVGAFLASVEELAVQAPVARYRAQPRHVFIDAGEPRTATAADTADTTVRQSLNGALRRILVDDRNAVVLGEDLAAPYGGAFKVTQGLSTTFPGRVISTPVSEAGLVGVGIGLALTGRRAVVEIMFADFMTLAMDQLMNQAVKLPDLFDLPLPLVVRTASGGRRGYGPTHSQCTDTLAAVIPGLTVVVPSHRHDPGLLLERACDWDQPTVIFEHKVLYGLACGAGPYREAPADPRDVAAAWFPTLIAGPADADLTIVTLGGALPSVEAAAVQLQAEELSVRIVAMSLLAPLPVHTLLGVLGTGTQCVAVVEEGPAVGGLGSEIATALLESGFSGTFIRIAAPPVPVPAARSLEDDVLPGTRRIVAEITARLGSVAIHSGQPS
ncbi:MAG TPA: thiamine pyrophosphate-dependent enzyme [Vicinamibacterales bacterium]|nr:thiamine pyrophosphate-dependent enzyme [Vicinamibacterales bacterium]